MYPRAHTTRTAGFTLLEALLCLGLMGILGGMAVPAFSAIRANWQLNTAARQVALDLRAARARAVATGTNQRVRFIKQLGSYQRQKQDGPQTYVNDGAPTQLPSGILVTACTAVGSAVTFRPRGNAITFGTVTLVDPGGRTRTVIVNMVGRTRIQ